MHHPLLFRLQTAWKDSFLLRWTVANIAGWTVGLYLVAWSFSTPALCLGGGLAGGMVGAAQWMALRREGFISHGAGAYPDAPPPASGQSDSLDNLPNAGRRWIVLSAAGGLVGLLPAAVAGLMVTFGWGFGIALVGGLIGAGVGAGQWFALQNHGGRAGWWILANVGGGAACALLTLAPLIRGLPLGLLLGTAVYGYLTGRALVWLSGQHSPA